MQFLECFHCGKIEPQDTRKDEELLCADCGSENVQLISEALLALRDSEDGGRTDDDAAG